MASITANPSLPPISSTNEKHKDHNDYQAIINLTPSDTSAVEDNSPPRHHHLHLHLHHRNRNEKQSSRDKKVKKEKEKGKDHHSRSKDRDPKAELKRSRSPIKMFRHIRTYIHEHKNRNSSSSNITINSLLSLHPHSRTTSLDPCPPPMPSRPIDDATASNHYRSNTFPSTNIVSSHQKDSNSDAAKAWKDKNRSGDLSADKQVLLLRVISYFEHAGHPADEETAEYLLRSYQWDIGETLQYCHDLVQAVQGPLTPVQPEIQMKGAVNDQYTSCYIDALLFAMFARLSAFEGLLSVNLDAESDSDSESASSGEAGDLTKVAKRQKALLDTQLLQTWLRIFVNQLRSGRLIDAHIVKELRQHLYTCGWNCPGPLDPPGSSRQEDSSELFMFLTEKLHLPYLPLEQRLLHGARFSADDDKVITERMLQIAVPSPSSESGLQAPSPDISKLESKFSKLLSSSTTTNNKETGSPSSSIHEVLSLEDLIGAYFYDNTLTGIRRLVSSGTGAPLSPGVEVPVSAWQVLELLPFYSSSNEQGGFVRASQSQYPTDVVILPLVLKRYSFGADMQAHRINTPIDIPRRFDFTRFVNPEVNTIPKPGDAVVPSMVPAAPAAPAAAPSLDNSNTTTSKDVGSNNWETYSSSLMSSAPTTQAPNVAAMGASSLQDPSSMSINTQRLPPVRKYTMSFLQAPDSPQTPITPPPQYSPAYGSDGKPMTFSSNDKKGWSPRPPQDEYGRDYMSCNQPRIKYMLELKSVVCHIGSRLDSGHYRSYVADKVGKDPSGAAATSSTSQSPHPLAFQEPNWLRHDDLDPSGHRVKHIERNSDDDMDMEADWARNGYILFYELQTINL
ncbi:hypothetical protein BGZ49_005694 [Haplosporangium sp. Z 27]|nr:hypothetical protein BGZ49_005694 [Haplosporangium sp. Z 27]